MKQISQESVTAELSCFYKSKLGQSTKTGVIKELSERKVCYRWSTFLRKGGITNVYLLNVWEIFI